MLCYRCGSHVPDGSSTCGSCGQAFAASGKKGARRSSSSLRARPPQAAGPYAKGDLISGRYEVRGVIGEGPIGVVYRAKDKEIDVQVAVKVITSKLLQTNDERGIFRREAKIARGLSHRNIIRIYDEDLDGDTPFVVMQHLEGLTLRKIIDLRLEQEGTFSLDELQPIMGQLLEALAYAHHEKGPDRKGLAHADLKPSNIIVLPDLLKVADFRQSMMVPRVPFVAAQKVRGQDAGYLAPELVAGEPVDVGADYYALGVLLGEMLTGKVYDPNLGLELHRENDSVPVSVTSIFMRLTAPRSRDRYQKIEHLRSDLQLAQEGKAPAHVGAFRPQITRMEKPEAELQVLHTGEFEVLESSEPKPTPEGSARRRTSFGLEAEAPPLDEVSVEDEEVLAAAEADQDLDPDDDDGAEAMIADDEILSDDEAFDDDEYDDDEYEDERSAPVPSEVATGEGIAFPESAAPWDSSSAEDDDEPATVPMSPSLELLLEKKREQVEAQPTGEALEKELLTGATVGRAPALDPFAELEKRSPEPPLLDDLLDAAHDLPVAQTVLRSKSPIPESNRAERTGPSELGGPLPPSTHGLRSAGRPQERGHSAGGQSRSFSVPLLVGVGVVIGLVTLLLVTDQGKRLLASFGNAESDRAVPVVSGDGDAGSLEQGLALAPSTPGTSSALDGSPTLPAGEEPPTPVAEAPALAAAKGSGETLPAAASEDGHPATRSAPSPRRGTTSRQQQRAEARTEARRRAREEAKARTARQQAARDAARALASAEAKASAEANDTERQRMIELERRRQEAEAARRAGEPPPKHSSPFSFDAVDRTMPVRSIGGGSETRRAGIQGGKSPTGSAAIPPAPPTPEAVVAQGVSSGPQDGRCPKGMVFVGAGGFMLGSSPSDPMRNFAEKTLHRVTTSAYCVDRFEHGGSRPTVRVTWFRAKELCERRGKRLCSEEEWEKACKGPRGLRFPYGNSFDASACNTEDAAGNDRPVKKPGSFKRCRSAFGVYDMAGNVAEWTSSTFQAGAAYRTQKGGASDRPDWDTRCATRGNRKPNTRNDHLGFRCCATPQ